LTLPRGSSHALVLGFRASNLRSARRLKPIAALRAPTIATTTHRKVLGVTGWVGHASANDAKANGSAKIVWEKRTRLA
jgi:hypothetical protein